MKKDSIMTERLRNRIRAARGEINPDLVLKGGRIINVFTREIIEGDVAIYDGVIVGIGAYNGPHKLDVTGHYVCPGFMDGHFHIESTMLSPPELAKAVLPYGTTAIIADPHEIANVMGKKGIEYIIDSSTGLPVDFFIMLPSCVPATHLETSGANLSCDDLIPFKDKPRVLGLAEMMNYPGVVMGAHDVLEKIAAFSDMTKDGHAPLLAGNDLNAYITAGLRSDHECSILEEAREKLRRGMHIMIREGTQAKNLKTLLPIVSPDTASRCSLVSDDLHPHDLLRKGHLNNLIDIAVEAGLDPVYAITMVTLNTARFFGLKNLGAIAPGYQADILILSSLQPITVNTVIKNGAVVFDNGRFIIRMPKPSKSEYLSPMNIRAYGPGSFTIFREGERIRIIGLIPDQLLTETRVIKTPAASGIVVPDIQRDIIKIAVVERHRGTGNIGLGMVQGFGLRRGALASSVAHDSHNIIAVGCTDSDLSFAVKTVEEMRGGLAAVNDGKVLSKLPLPIAGLMSDKTVKDVARGWEKMAAAAQNLGCYVKEPFMALSFLALPVIPDLKITDKGLVDVRQFQHVPLFL